ncbi:hypothetical protein P2318_15070 [Myxococcaceae bacterium GXIMD 01537]
MLHASAGGRLPARVMPPPPNPYRCSTHLGVPAGWECLHCARRLCPDCAATGTTRSAARAEVSFTCCVPCDGPVRPLMVEGVSSEAFRVGLLSVLTGPAGLFTVASGFLLVLGVVLIHRVGPTLRVFLLGAFSFALACMTFAVIRTVADGAAGTGASSRVDPREDVLQPALRSLALAGAGLALIAGLEAVLGGGSQWVVRLLLGVLALLVPAWLLALAMGEPLLEAVAPGRSVEIVQTLGRDYALVAALSFGAVQLSSVWLSVSSLGLREGFSFFSAVLEMCSAAVLLFLARVLGQLLQTRGSDLGYGKASVTLLPAMPGAVPRGVRRSSAIAR